MKRLGLGFVGLVIVVAVLSVWIWLGNWQRARYRECRAHGFSPSFCINQ